MKNSQLQETDNHFFKEMIEETVNGSMNQAIIK